MNRDRLDVAGTSALSQDLHFGLLSPATVLHQTAGADRFVEEVAWRDFYFHLAWHSPSVLRGPYRDTLAALPWVNDPAALSAWKSGQTGYPVVDAAMRQLVATGWMHNRARMIVASFLAKHLLVDYREGERFFMQHLIDGDVAVNNGGWQWASSTRTGPALLPSLQPHPARTAIRSGRAVCPPLGPRTQVHAEAVCTRALDRAPRRPRRRRVCHWEGLPATNRSARFRYRPRQGPLRLDLTGAAVAPTRRNSDRAAIGRRALSMTPHSSCWPVAKPFGGCETPPNAASRALNANRSKRFHH